MLWSIRESMCVKPGFRMHGQFAFLILRQIGRAWDA